MTTITVPSFRRTFLQFDAAKKVSQRYRGSSKVKALIEAILDTDSGKRLFATALRPAGKVDGLIQRVMKTQRLPIGAIRTEDHLRDLLESFVEAVRAFKREELERVRAMIAESPTKPAVAAEMEEHKAELIERARASARFLKVSRGELDRLYDRAHGMYGSIRGYVALRRQAMPLEELIAHIRGHYRSLGYREVRPRPSQRYGVEQAQVFEMEGMYVLNCPASGLSEPLSKLTRGAVIFAGGAEAFEKDAWSYVLYVNGKEVDRHCSNPLAMAEVSELLEEGESEVLVKGLCQTWCGDPSVVAGAFGVDRESVRSYLIQLYPWELNRIWRDKRLFVKLKASNEDRYSLAGPWVFLDLLNSLGGKRGNPDAIWDTPAEMISFKKPSRR